MLSRGSNNLGACHREQSVNFRSNGDDIFCDKIRKIAYIDNHPNENSPFAILIFVISYFVYYFLPKLKCDMET